MSDTGNTAILLTDPFVSKLAGRLIFASRFQLLFIAIFQDNSCRRPMIC
jgi:hypothetical protein